MKKEDIDWSIDMKKFKCVSSEDEAWILVNINGDEYLVDPKTACLTHSILLLVDSMNDKKIS